MTPAEQLREELTRRAWELHSLGLHFADPYDPVAQSQIAQRAAAIVAELRQDEDDGLSGRAAIDVMTALWPDCDPIDSGRPDWWTSPLGRLVAKAGGVAGTEAVTYADAARMLVVNRSAVTRLVDRGKLETHPDGGVLRSAVYARLATATAR